MRSAFKRWSVPALAAALACSPSADAADADAAWSALLELDAGPRVKVRGSTEGRAAALAHLERQEKALREFLRAHGDDTRAFEAQLRLARLLQIRADVQGAPKALAESTSILDALEKSATPDQRAEVDFARLTLQMRSMKQPSPGQRDQLLAAARKFQAAHPTDRRLAALLAEIATLFRLQPRTMETLLQQAAPLASDPELKQRIGDDLRKLDLLGEPLTLNFTSVDGQPFELADAKNSVVLIVFFAVWSPPSTEALLKLRQTLGGLAGERVQAVGISLDTEPKRVSAMLKKNNINWPVACDGKGWESPLARDHGINSLPTAWLVDPAGRLRSLDALSATESQIRQLLNSR